MKSGASTRASSKSRQPSGLFVSLAVILIVQNSMSREAFGAWGWRIPFLISIFLVGISLYIRLRMKESPIFQHIKSTGMTSAKPLKEAFTQWDNLKRVLISLFGATAGQGVVWYTGQFYALFYLQTVLKVNGTTANYIVATRIASRHAVFRFVRRAFRSHRAKEDHDGRMSARRDLLHSDLSGDAGRGGSNVVTVASQKNPVTGATSLTPLVDTAGTPAKEVLPYTSLSDFIGECRCAQAVSAGVHPGDLCHDGLRSDRRLPGRSVSRPRSATPRCRFPITSGTESSAGCCRSSDCTSLRRPETSTRAVLPIVVASMTFVVGSLLLKETHHVKIWKEWRVS